MYYLLGSAIGLHPYPTMVCVLESVMGREAREQSLQLRVRRRHAVVACVGRGPNAIGTCTSFMDDADVRLRRVGAGRFRIARSKHAASIVARSVGVLHG